MRHSGFEIVKQEVDRYHGTDLLYVRMVIKIPIETLNEIAKRKYSIKKKLVQTAHDVKIPATFVEWDIHRILGKIGYWIGELSCIEYFGPASPKEYVLSLRLYIGESKKLSWSPDLIERVTNTFVENFENILESTIVPEIYKNLQKNLQKRSYGS